MIDIKKKDNAKRQAEYRKRHIKEGSDQRLNVIEEALRRQHSICPPGEE